MALLNSATLSITMKQLMEMMQTNVITTSEFARQVIGIDDSIKLSEALKDHIELESEVQDKITFVERALRIYHSSTGGRSLNLGITEQMVFPDENDVYFYIKVHDYAIRELVFVVQDIYFEIPVNNIPTGMGFITQFKGVPQADKAVENVKGEIADFIGDYLDEYGTEDEFVPR
jgi:hypothetical protein